MTRGWGHGLLALLFLVMMVLGGTLPQAMVASSAYGPVPPSAQFMSGRLLPANTMPDRGIEVATAFSYPVGNGKRDRSSRSTDPVPLPTLLVVAIALFYALPLRGSDVARALRIGLTPEGRHREAGRCPTGPPAFAG